MKQMLDLKHHPPNKNAGSWNQRQLVSKASKDQDRKPHQAPINRPTSSLAQSPAAKQRHHLIKTPIWTAIIACVLYGSWALAFGAWSRVNDVKGKILDFKLQEFQSRLH